MTAVGADADYDGLVINRLAIRPFSVLGTALRAVGHLSPALTV